MHSTHLPQYNTPPPVNGSETDTSAEHPTGALNRFYKAFNTRDEELMRDCWADSPDISMCNPLGGILRGWDALSVLYRRIFSGEAVVWVEFYDYTLHQSEDMLVFSGRERGTVTTTSGTLSLAIRTTRIFVRQAGKWRLLHHHGSISNPDLLSAYLTRLNLTPNT